MRTLRWGGLLLALMLAISISNETRAQDIEEEVGPRVLVEVGAEKPFNAPDLDRDLLLRWAAGVEWPGVFGHPDVWFTGGFSQVGWGSSDIETESRWNWGLKGYPESYWPRANPWLALGVEHEGGGFIVDQTNVTWLAIGIEPELPVGWLSISWQTTGWLMDREPRYRMAIGFIPGEVLE